jgi:Tol biopolymer transport system component
VRDALEGRVEPSELREGARALEAGLLLRGALKVVAAQPLGGSADEADHTLVFEGELFSTVDQQGRAVGEPPLRIHRSAATDEAALLESCDELAEQLAPRVAEAAVSFPSIAALLDPGASSRGLDERVIADRLGPLVGLVASYGEARSKRAAAERRLRARDRKLEQGPRAKHLVGAYLGEEYFVGPGAGGTILTMALPARLVVDDPVKATYRMQPGHEQLLLRRPDGGVERVLVELFNLYSYPSVSADGSVVAYVADHRRWSKALHVAELAGGAAEEIFHHRSHYPSSPVIAPDGSRIAFVYGETRRGPKRLEIVDRDGSDRRVLVAGPLDRLDLPAWSPDGAALYVTFQPSGQPHSSLWRIDAATGEATALLGDARRAAEPSEPERLAGPEAEPRAGGGSSFASPAVAPDGSFVLVAEGADGAGWLGRYEVDSGAYRRLLQARVGRIAISPAGDRIAFETGPTAHPDDPHTADVEIAVMSARGEQLELLTLNARRDGLAGWSRDGKRIYFHQGNRDPDGHRYDNRIYWLEP